MRLLKKLKVPTGEIYTAQGDKKILEFLSVGDYGKNANIKADFLGITRELNGVPNGNVLSLSEKWVITISTQYGCSMNCKFCDVPKVGRGLNVTVQDLNNQIICAILNNFENCKKTKRLNIHYARMGEPTFNPSVLTQAGNLKNLLKKYIDTEVIHPVISTMLPRNNRNLSSFLTNWVSLKNKNYNGDAGLQFSINSTDEFQREEMFSNNSLSLDEISLIGGNLAMPKGRKYALNFALADNYIIDASKLVKLFHPDKFMVKITPLHKTRSCEDNNLITTQGYEAFTPYKEIEENLKKVGFDVIVFVPSYDEDLGLITCGNAILSGSKPHKYIETNYSKE